MLAMNEIRHVRRGRTLANGRGTGAGSCWLSIRLLAGCSWRRASCARQDVDNGWCADIERLTIVQVEESAAVSSIWVSALALVEDVGAAKREGAIAADGPSSREDGSGLGRVVELELEVCGDVTGSLGGVGEFAIHESDGQ